VGVWLGAIGSLVLGSPLLVRLHGKLKAQLVDGVGAVFSDLQKGTDGA
jgi:hypothetical protein